MTSSLPSSAPAPTGWAPSGREKERAAVRRAQRRRGLLVSSAVTVVVLGGAAVGITASPGWPTVQETFFSGYDARQVLPDVLDAFLINVAMFLIAEPIILVLGAAIALARVSTSPWLTPLRLLAVAYTDLFRGLPTIVVVLLFGFGVPALQLQGVTNSPFVLATIALVLCYSAYVAEVFRAGIESVHASQTLSAQALALSRTQTLRHVVMPQAVRRVVPPLLNDFVSLQKDTALVSTIGVFEATFVAQDYGNFNFNYTGLVVAGACFVVICVPVARFTDWLARRARLKAAGR